MPICSHVAGQLCKCRNRPCLGEAHSRRDVETLLLWTEQKEAKSVRAATDRLEFGLTWPNFCRTLSELFGCSLFPSMSWSVPKICWASTASRCPVVSTSKYRRDYKQRRMEVSVAIPCWNMACEELTEGSAMMTECDVFLELMPYTLCKKFTQTTESI